LRQKVFGERTAKVVRRRLDELHAAGCLADIAKLPAARCHELKGDREGQLAVDLDHPRRLVFEPSPPPPLRDDGGLDWSKVTSIVVIEVIDYH
jgi:plasmid maintenance system killer protein